MIRILDILWETGKKTGLNFLPNERFTLDVDMFPENGEERRFPNQVLFENPPLKNGKKRLQKAPTSMFRYFLDRSQRSHRAIAVSVGGRYLPICAGQIGAAALERNAEERLVPLRELSKFENIIAVPNIIDQDDIPLWKGGRYNHRNNLNISSIF